MRCKACDCSIEARLRNVRDELGVVHTAQEDLCGYCISQAKLGYSEPDDEDFIRENLKYAHFKAIY